MIPRTIQKDNNTIPKIDITTQKDSNTILKALEPIQAEVLRYIMAHPQTTREEIADSIDGISFGGVKFIIAKLQKKGLLKRIGGRKHGEWQVLILKKRMWFVPHPLISSLKSRIIGMDYHLIAIFFWFTIYTPEGRDSMLSVSPAAIFTVLMSMPFVEKMFTHLVMSLWI